MRNLLAAALMAALPTCCSAASAEALRFGPDLAASGWTVVRFPGIAPASFTPVDPATLQIATDAGAGLLWGRANAALRTALTAQWRWRVVEGVPPTDLTRRGADDRAIGVYFVFGDAADADKAPLALLRSSSVTTLVYVFGGDAPRGTVLPSPHMGARGKFIVLRAADTRTAWLDERVDLAGDHLRAFGVPPKLLLAVAISSDSDDTRTRNRAEVTALNVGP